MDLQYQELTGEIIEAFYTVYNRLGHGFLEKVYENAMMIELTKQGLDAKRQQAINVYYDDQVVGEYYADIVVADKVIVELKVAKVLDEKSEAQLLNYLKATDMEVGLLLNFGLSPAFKRRIFSNRRK